MTPKRKKQRDAEFERQPTEKARAYHGLASLAECHRDTRRNIPKAQANLTREFNNDATSLAGHKTSYSRPCSLYRGTSLTYRSGAVVSGIGDAALWIVSGKIFFGLLAMVSIGIAFILAAIVHVFFASLRNHEPPKSRIRLMEKTAWGAFIFFVVNLLLFLVATRLPYGMGLLFAPFVPLMALGLSIGLLILAAALWKLAGIYGRFHAINRQYDALDEEYLLTQFSHIPYFKDLVDDNGGPPPSDTWDDPSDTDPTTPPQLSDGGASTPPPNDNRRQITAKTGLGVILAISALTNAACVPPPPPPPGPVVYLDIIRDVSTSSAETDRQTLERSVYNQIPEIVTKVKAAKLRVLSFSHDAVKAEQVFEMDLPLAPHVEDFKPELGAEAGQIKKFVEDAEADAKEKYTEVFSDYEKEVKERFKQIAFEQIFPVSKQEGDCSDVNGVIHRTVSDASASSPHFVLILSDGQQSCAAARDFDPIFTAPQHARIVFLMLPLTTENRGTSQVGMKDRKEALKKAFPWIRPLDYFTTASLAEALMTTDTTTR